MYARFTLGKAFLDFPLRGNVLFCSLFKRTPTSVLSTISHFFKPRSASFYSHTNRKVTSFATKRHMYWQKPCLYVCVQRNNDSGGGMHTYWQWAVKIYPYNAHSSPWSKTSRRFVRIRLQTHQSIRMILRKARIYTSDGLDFHPLFQQHMDMYSLSLGETEKPREVGIWFVAPGKGRAQEWELFLRRTPKQK